MNYKIDKIFFSQSDSFFSQPGKKVLPEAKEFPPFAKTFKVKVTDNANKKIADKNKKLSHCQGQSLPAEKEKAGHSYEHKEYRRPDCRKSPGTGV